MHQPAQGYRAGVDPVLLAASVEVGPGAEVLELGCGVGVAALALAARTGCRVTGLELQPGYAALARRNATENDLPVSVIEGDLRRMPGDLRARSFDAVMMNPPWFDRARSVAASDTGRETALGEGAALADWLRAGARRLAPRGWLHVIHRAERLGDLLAAIGAAGLGSVELRPVCPRPGRDSALILARARKGGRADLRLLAPLILHSAARPEGRHDDYTPEITYVLRHGASLAWTAGSPGISVN